MDREELIDCLVTNNHISYSDAKSAVDQCLVAVAKKGAEGYVAGGLLGIFLGTRTST